jgi:3',5'-cyclic-AMP phosphodiesterase
MIHLAPHTDPADSQQSGSEVSMTVIAHLSDPHLSRQHYREHIKSLKSLLRSILDDGVDHLVVTGDIVSTADPDDYHLAREIFSHFGLMHRDRLTVVPGNHDIFGGPHRATEVPHFPRHLRTVDYRRKHMLFEEAFAETFEGVYRAGNSRLYPFIKIVGSSALIAFDSTMPWSLMRNPFGSNGRLGAAQLASFAGSDVSTLLHGRIPLVVMHHHLHDYVHPSGDLSLWDRLERRTMRLHHPKRALRLFSMLGVKSVLHGHVHSNTIAERQGVLFVNGAGAVCDDPVQFLKYNRIVMVKGRISARIRVLPQPYYSPMPSRSIHRFHSVHSEPKLAGVT